MDAPHHQHLQQHSNPAGIQEQLGAISMGSTNTWAAGDGEGSVSETVNSNAPAGAGIDAGGGDRERPFGVAPEDRGSVLLASISPEDIVLCVDVGPEMNSDWVGGGSGGVTTSRLRVVQGALRGFVHRKASFNPKHRFALVTLGDGVKVVRPLTSDIRGILEALERLQPLQPPDALSSAENDPDGKEDSDDGETPFDFSELLKCISERFTPSRDIDWNRSRGSSDGTATMAAIPQVRPVIRPVVRAVVIYGRSFTCPLVPRGEGKPALLSHGRFFLDCLYVHRSPSEPGVVCEDAFDAIANLDTRAGRGQSYFLACRHNLQQFNTNLVSLMAHPFQRDLQETFFCKLASPGVSSSGIIGGVGAGGNGGSGSSQHGSSLASGAGIATIGAVAAM